MLLCCVLTAPRLVLNGAVRGACSSRHRHAAAAACAAPPPPSVPLPDGVLVVHKPQSWSSFSVVAKIRNTLQDHYRGHGHKFTGRKKLKVGHGGTLDPMATGVLVVGVGKGCKALEGYLRGSKSYAAVAQFGSETDTQDAEGVVIGEAPFGHVTDDELAAAAAGLTGEIMQRPPIYSALKRDGKRMYELARKGEVSEEEMEPRRVVVHELRLAPLQPATGAVEMQITCGGGTYVRSLVVELGRAVGSAAHMSALLRTQQGPFCIDDSWPPPSESLRRVTPVVEAEFTDAARLLAAMEEAAQVLREVEEAEGAEKAEGVDG